MREFKCFCDRCGKQLKDSSICNLSYEGLLGHNQIPIEGWDFCYSCLSIITNLINKNIKKDLEKVK